jgi:D-ribose pyranase
MKERGLLHPELSAIVAAMGHGDLLGIVDAGFPVPLATPRVDLAFASGKPTFEDVLTALVDELVVESYVVAEESRHHAPWLAEVLADRLPHAGVVWMDHETLKARSTQARALVRTGEFRPYANVLLAGGVPFAPPGHQALSD